MNYAVCNTQSSLITNIITSSSLPASNSINKFIEIGNATLSRYCKLLNKRSRNGAAVGVGELAFMSPSFAETLAQTR